MSWVSEYEHQRIVRRLEAAERKIQALVTAIGLLNVSTAPAVTWLEANIEKIEQEAAVREISLEELDLKVRPYNVLMREGVRTLADLLELTWADLADMRNMGTSGVTNIEETLAARGLHLKEIKDA